MGLLAAWYKDFFGPQTAAVLPYEQHLKRLPAYLQQLTMESSGKRVALDGTEVNHDTAPVYRGSYEVSHPALPEARGPRAAVHRVVSCPGAEIRRK